MAIEGINGVATAEELMERIIRGTDNGNPRNHYTMLTMDATKQKLIVYDDRSSGTEPPLDPCRLDILKKYLGEIIENKRTKEKIEIGTKFADEYTGSKYSEHIRGARAKVKANATQGIRELVESAANKIHSENKKSKHKKDAKGGWNYYMVRFALPVYDNNRKTEEYNVYMGRLVVNRIQDGKLYLYDLVEIKKEASTPLKNT